MLSCSRTFQASHAPVTPLPTWCLPSFLKECNIGHTSDAPPPYSRKQRKKEDDCCMNVSTVVSLNRLFFKHPVLPFILQSVTFPSASSCSLVCATSGLKWKGTSCQLCGHHHHQLQQQQLFSNLTGGRAFPWACPCLSGQEVLEPEKNPSTICLLLCRHDPSLLNPAACRYFASKLPKN